MTNPIITINARKYDGELHRTWRAELVSRQDELLVLRGVFEVPVEHPDLGHIVKGTISFEYYWLNRWFNIFRFHEPDGAFRNFYCNINKPPVFDGTTLEYVDLDIDLLVAVDMSVTLLDLKEFENNASRFGYDKGTIQMAKKQVPILQEMIATERYPFDRTDMMRQL